MLELAHRLLSPTRMTIIMDSEVAGPDVGVSVAEARQCA